MPPVVLKTTQSRALTRTLDGSRAFLVSTRAQLSRKRASLSWRTSEHRTRDSSFLARLHSGRIGSLYSKSSTARSSRPSRARSSRARKRGSSSVRTVSSALASRLLSLTLAARPIGGSRWQTVGVASRSRRVARATSTCSASKTSSAWPRSARLSAISLALSRIRKSSKSPPAKASRACSASCKRSRNTMRRSATCRA